MRHRISIRGSVRPSVRLSVRPSVRPLRLFWYFADDASSCPPGLVLNHSVKTCIRYFTLCVLFTDLKEWFFFLFSLFWYDSSHTHNRESIEWNIVWIKEQTQPEHERVCYRSSLVLISRCRKDRRQTAAKLMKMKVSSYWLREKKEGYWAVCTPLKVARWPIGRFINESRYTATRVVCRRAGAVGQW